MKVKSADKLLTAVDMADIFSEFADDRARLKYMKTHYSNMSIIDSFNKFYSIDVSTEDTYETNTVTIIEVGNCYWGKVEAIDKNGIEFSIPGVKEEIISKENFSDSFGPLQLYLNKTEGMLYFEVREKKNNKYYVSVMNAYYNAWIDEINAKIKANSEIDVHIDSLTNGGYLCHTAIESLQELTGKNYTMGVFIPGSNIVLNIERDFDRWVGQDVKIIPQKFTKFKQHGKPIENSLIGSRKQYLQTLGMKNLYDIYTQDESIKKLSEISNVTYTKSVFEGTVTGIINSNKKTGIFVELNDKFITGLMPLDASELLNYKPGDPINVIVEKFEVQDGKTPFVFNKKNQLVFSNTRCVFKEVKD